MRETDLSPRHLIAPLFVKEGIDEPQPIPSMPGQSQHSLAVYLRRGRALLGVYFPHPDGAQSAVKGQTSIASIVNVFATRMAQLPAAAVNR